MGAQLWFHTSGPHESPADALREIQSRCIAEIDLDQQLQARIKSVSEAVAITERDDEYGLLDLYRQELKTLKTLEEEGVPKDAPSQVEFLRKIYSAGGDPIESVLDVKNVAARGNQFVTGQLTDTELQKWVGHEKPTEKEAEAAISTLNENLGRAESVCFKIYSEDRSEAIGWMFVGNTAD